MTAGRLDEQEFVAHLFAPVDGPAATDALRELELLWDACRTELGMTRRIDGTGLATELPAEPGSAPEGALAGLQDPAVDFQAVVRREHDMLNFSLVMAQPRRMRLGAATPPGWFEYARWWRKLTAGGLGAFLGGGTVFLAKGPADVRDELPPAEDDADEWWTRPLAVNDLALWEATAGGARAFRRLVVLGLPAEDARLSRFTWSAGDVALPPLGRYLMHAARLRYQARVRGDGEQIRALRDRATARLNRAAAGDHDLAGDLAEVAGTLQALTWMQLSVEASAQNMASVLPAPLPSDRALATAVTRWLADDVYYLRTVQDRARLLAPVVSLPVTSALTPPVAGPPREPDGRAEYRMGFGIDVVRYSDRTTPGQFEVQRRLAGMVADVLDGIGVPLRDSDRQDAGDGMMVVLPARVQPHLALPGLLNGWRARLAADNGEHPGDRIRLRLSVTVGRFAPSAIGFTGATIIETGRLLDSDALRQGIKDHPDADLVALVSDRIYQDVVGEGYPGLDAGHFVPVRVRVKTYDRQAWLWRGVPAGPGVGDSVTVPEPRTPAGGEG
ncbi:CATRA conflict system CASPASE/TPR repeat-associated protein [Actinoplanes couchii]|uniref:Guanylate cyclase domain-containing protein n=1 Tax=Actinoplanes couchii TaxID=403638 RepID=A0ABQ3X7X8_9ACTN|nr:CATRA conflict system CASPASE/TPR repeat-associated protein [Actinoplanes couchii]MDR6320376.1 hypothetical protein [Actinoplanes couchii]GID54611.1 hypothetical protein Aco03nite_030150 [Actinoplanes couchii]